MKNFELKRKAMLNLTILVLLAFSLYSSTEGNTIEDKESYGVSSKIIEELATYRLCLSKSTMKKTIKSCLAGEGVVDASPGFATEEECKRAYKLAGNCFANYLDTCGVHPRLRAASTILFNRLVSTRTCLESAENN